MFKDALTGAGYLVRGIRQIATPGIRRFALIPICINAVAFGLVVAIAARFYSVWMGWLLPAGDAWWLLMAKALLWLLFALVIVITLFFTFTVLANLIAAPFNGFLADAVEQRSAGAASTGLHVTPSIWREVPRAFVNELRKLGYYCVWALPLGLLFVVPLVQLAAPFAWGLFVAWMLALEYGDYPMANHGIGFVEVRQRMRRHTALSLGFGGAVMAAMLIPVLNLIVMPAAVAGATLMWLDRLRDPV